MERQTDKEQARTEAALAGGFGGDHERNTSGLMVGGHNKGRDRVSDKQMAFVRSYARHHVGARAAREAGYSESSAKSIGTQLLAKEKIRTALAAEEERIEKSFDISREAILKGIFNETTDSQAGIRLKAWELLGKAKGVFVEKQQQTGSGIVFNLNLQGAPIGVIGTNEAQEVNNLLNNEGSREGKIPPAPSLPVMVNGYSGEVEVIDESGRGEKKDP